MKNWNLRRSLIFSLCFHVLLVFFFFSKALIEVGSSQSQRIEVAVFERSRALDRQEVQPKSQSVQKSAGGSRRLKLQDLMPANNHFSFSTPPAEKSNGEFVNDGSGDRMAPGMSMKQAAELRPSLLWIQKKIDEHLSYPEELALYEKEGQVSIEVDLNREGIPDPKSFSIRAADSILKVYVLQVLDQALARPLPEPKMLSQPVRVRLIFDFVERYETFEPLKLEPVTQNYLHFVRSHSPPKYIEAWTKESNDQKKDEQVNNVGIRLDTIFSEIMLARKKRRYKELGIDPLEKYKHDPRY
jgi:hypothetical protein